MITFAIGVIFYSKGGCKLPQSSLPKVRPYSDKHPSLENLQHVYAPGKQLACTSMHAEHKLAQVKTRLVYTG